MCKQMAMKRKWSSVIRWNKNGDKCETIWLVGGVVARLACPMGRLKGDLLHIKNLSMWSLISLNSRNKTGGCSYAGISYIILPEDIFKKKDCCFADKQMASLEFWAAPLFWYRSNFLQHLRPFSGNWGAFLLFFLSLLLLMIFPLFSSLSFSRHFFSSFSLFISTCFFSFSFLHHGYHLSHLSQLWIAFNFLWDKCVFWLYISIYVFLYFVVKTLNMLFGSSLNLLWCSYIAIQYSKLATWSTLTPQQENQMLLLLHLS